MPMIGDRSTASSGSLSGRGPVLIPVCSRRGELAPAADGARRAASRAAWRLPGRASASGGRRRWSAQAAASVRRSGTGTGRRADVAVSRVLQPGLDLGQPAASCRRARRSCRRPRPGRGRARRARPRRCVCSTSRRGARRSGCRAPGASYPAPAARLRSILPFGVSGSVVEDDEGRRHHVVRQLPAPGWPAAPPAVGAAPSARHATVGDQAAVAGAARRVRRPPPRATPRVRPSAASISPSSMRKPRIFTWWSSRPRNSRLPSGRQRARSPVRYSRAPSARAERVGDEPLGGQRGPAAVAAGDARCRRRTARRATPMGNARRWGRARRLAYWRSAGRSRAAYCRRGRPPRGRPDAVFGRSVVIDQPPTRGLAGPAMQHVTAGEQRAQVDGALVEVRQGGFRERGAGRRW